MTTSIPICVGCHREGDQPHDCQRTPWTLDVMQRSCRCEVQPDCNAWRPAR